MILLIVSSFLTSLSLIALVKGNTPRFSSAIRVLRSDIREHFKLSFIIAVVVFIIFDLFCLFFVVRNYFM